MNLKSNKFWKIFLIQAILFFLTQILGIFSAVRIQKIPSFLKVEILQISFFNLILDFTFATLFIFLIMKYFKPKLIKRKIYKFLFVFTSFLAGIIFFGIFFPGPIPFILIFLLISWWLKVPSVFNQNLLMVFGIAGIGSILGLSLKPPAMILILILFSIYDFAAVYKTKHMVEMVKEMVEQKVILGFVIPQHFSSFKENLEKIQPGGEFLILGGGDVAFPLLFSVSLVSEGISKSFIISIFSLFGLFANLYFFLKQKERKPMPALPLISLFSIIGYLITILLK